MPGFEGRTAIVTGGAGGLGAAICRELGHAGASVVVADVRADAARAVAVSLCGSGVRAYPSQLDLRDEASVGAVYRQAESVFGRVDILVNNAGTDVTAPVLELSTEDWDRIIDVNLRGAFLMARGAFEAMSANGGGSIVNIVSTAAKRAWPNASAYHASKWGLLGLSHALHVEGRPLGIKVTAVISGGMQTPFILDRFPETDPDCLQPPESVAEAVRFVLSQPEGTVVPGDHGPADAGDLLAVRRRAVFLDKDGTLVENVPYNVDPTFVRFAEGAFEALGMLRDAGFALVLVSNQSGVGRGYFGQSDLRILIDHLRAELGLAAVPLAGAYCCTHAPGDGCPCRKPLPGLIRRAASDLDLDLPGSWAVGDILDDVEAGRRAGCRAVLVDSGGETEWHSGEFREPDFVAPTLLEAASCIVTEHARTALRPSAPVRLL